MPNGQFAYLVVDWETHYEKAQTRKVRRFTSWVPIPNKHDGKGYRRVAALEDAADVFCAWILILQVGSRCATRGLLADSDGPLDADDLAAKTGFPSRIFDRAFEVLTDRKIKWLEKVVISPDGTHSHDATIISDNSGSAFQPGGATGQDITEQDKGRRQVAPGGSYPLPEETYRKHPALRIMHECIFLRPLSLEQWLRIKSARHPFMDHVDAAEECVRRAELEMEVRKPAVFVDRIFGYHEKDNIDTIRERKAEFDRREKEMDDLAAFWHEVGFDSEMGQRNRRDWLTTRGERFVLEAERRLRKLEEANNDE